MNEWDQFGVRVGYCNHNRRRSGKPLHLIIILKRLASLSFLQELIEEAVEAEIGIVR